MKAPPPHYPETMQRVARRTPSACAVGATKPCVVVVPKEVAQAFVELHHSTQPYINPRGLLYTLGVIAGGQLHAVATVNTPTARFRDRGCDVRSIVDLSRVASDGKVLGAASMLASKAIDLLPVSARDGGPACLLVTYSLIQQAGTTYAALVDKGLRPVEYVEGQRPTGQRRKSSMMALPTTPKIRWEAGSAAMPADWSLLAGKLPDERIRAMAARLAEFDRRNRR